MTSLPSIFALATRSAAFARAMAGSLPPPDRGRYKFVDLEGKWLSSTFSALNRRVDKGIVAS